MHACMYGNLAYVKQISCILCVMCHVCTPCVMYARHVSCMYAMRHVCTPNIQRLHLNVPKIQRGRKDCSHVHLVGRRHALLCLGFLKIDFACERELQGLHLRERQSDTCCLSSDSRTCCHGCDSKVSSDTISLADRHVHISL